MAAPAAALPIAFTARSAAKGIGDLLGSDLLVIRTQQRLGRGKKARVADLELHLNPLNLGLAAVGAAVTVWALQMRVAPTMMPISYGKYVWPSDGTDATKVMEFSKLPPPPTRQIGSTTVWRVYTGDFPNPYAVVSEGTAGAVMTVVPIMETANYFETEVKEETRLAVKQRQGFLGGGVGTTAGDSSLPLAAFSPSIAFLKYLGW